MSSERGGKDKYTKISRDNEITTKYAVNSFGSRQLILDPFVPDCVFAMDCCFTQWVQAPVRSRDHSKLHSLLFSVLYWFAVLVNSRPPLSRRVFDRVHCGRGDVFLVHRRVR
jgi:hypothetical protein